MIPAPGVVIFLHAAQAELQPLPAVGPAHRFQGQVCEYAEPLPVAGHALMAVDLPQPFRKVISFPPVQRLPHLVRGEQNGVGHRRHLAELLIVIPAGMPIFRVARVGAVGEAPAV